MDNAEEPALVELFRHNLWANLKLLDVCGQLELERLDVGAPGTYGNAYRTLVHSVAAEEWYGFLLTSKRLVERMADTPPGLAELRNRASRSGERLIELARSLPPAQRARWQQGEEEVSVSSAQLLAQAINHSTEHRTHVTTILSQNGINHPLLSEWAYLSEQGGAAAPRAFLRYAG
jgi:uncharacterized damage-inducible protein DinB